MSLAPNANAMTLHAGDDDVAAALIGHLLPSLPRSRGRYHSSSPGSRLLCQFGPTWRRGGEVEARAGGVGRYHITIKPEYESRLKLGTIHIRLESSIIITFLNQLSVAIRKTKLLLYTAYDRCIGDAKHLSKLLISLRRLSLEKFNPMPPRRNPCLDFFILNLFKTFSTFKAAGLQMMLPYPAEVLLHLIAQGAIPHVSFLGITDRPAHTRFRVQLSPTVFGNAMFNNYLKSISSEGQRECISFNMSAASISRIVARNLRQRVNPEIPSKWVAQSYLISTSAQSASTAPQPVQGAITSALALGKSSEDKKR
ncbi:UNVERIFIED_CONTAM: hypothetical protein Scaly_1899200 [Sesamum calycinum]|uniref:Uncharacterized protein n=1 Tax=Sesamum calycinum TaxID=2727403 RepID=A0AAW2NIT0_9LAMI